jgi:UMF1 family MFS transporter
VLLFGEAGRGQPLLPAVILFIIFSLPMLLWFKVDVAVGTASIRKEATEYVAGFKRMWAIPGVGLFLLSFFFFNDAILTTANNFPIYMEQLFGVTDTTKVFLMLGVLTTSALGAFAGGWLTDKVGARKFFLVILAIWILFFPVLGITTHFPTFRVLVIIMGVLYGATWSVTRAVMAGLLPRHMLNQGFSYYTLFERFSTLVGPLAWGAITTGLVSYGSVRYQFAAFGMALFVVIGFYIARKIPQRDAMNASL